MKKNKGFTIVELIVSFSLLMIVIIYLLRTIIVVGNKENELLTLQEYTILETNLLKQIYEDMSSLNALEVGIYDRDNKMLIDGVGKYIEFDKENNYIIYGDIIYELPEGAKISDNPYSVTKIEDSTMISTNNVFYVCKINLVVNNKAKSLKIVHQYYDDSLTSSS